MHPQRAHGAPGDDATFRIGGHQAHPLPRPPQPGLLRRRARRPGGLQGGCCCVHVTRGDGLTGCCPPLDRRNSSLQRGSPPSCSTRPTFCDGILLSGMSTRVELCSACDTARAATATTHDAPCVSVRVPPPGGLPGPCSPGTCSLSIPPTPPPGAPQAQRQGLPRKQPHRDVPRSARPPTSLSSHAASGRRLQRGAPPQRVPHSHGLQAAAGRHSAGRGDTGTGRRSAARCRPVPSAGDAWLMRLTRNALRRREWPGYRSPEGAGSAVTVGGAASPSTPRPSPAPQLLPATRHGGATVAELRWAAGLHSCSALASGQAARGQQVCRRHDVPGGWRRRQAQGGGRACR